MPSAPNTLWKGGIYALNAVLNARSCVIKQENVIQEKVVHLVGMSPHADMRTTALHILDDILTALNAGLLLTVPSKRLPIAPVHCTFSANLLVDV